MTFLIKKLVTQLKDYPISNRKAFKSSFPQLSNYQKEKKKKCKVKFFPKKSFEAKGFKPKIMRP